MNSYVLHGYGESVASNDVRLALAEKNIPYDYNLVYLESKGDHLRDEYKKLNPKTLVPTLTVNGDPICESIEIMKFIDKEHPDQGSLLFPNESDAFNKLIDYLRLDDENELGNTFGTTGGGISVPVLGRLLCKRSFLAVLWDYLKNHGVKQRKSIFVMVRLFGGPPPGFYKKMMTFLAKHLVYIENYLKHENQFIFGDKYTAADCLLTVLLHRTNEMRFYDVFDGKLLPNISKYWKTVTSRPSYKEAIIDYETGEWKPELDALYGNRANTYSGILIDNINKILKKEN